MKDIKKRAILAVIAIILLVGLLLYTSVAWYTKMTSVQGLSFNAARWDFSANYQVDDFEINVYKYTTIGQYGQEDQRFAAPGTKGEIHMVLSAERSNTDVTYLVEVNKSTASKEFQKRLYFYYHDKNGNPIEFINDGIQKQVLTGTINYGRTSDITIYWEWIFDFDEYLQKNDTKRYEFAKIVRPIYESSVGQVFNADDFITLYQYKHNATYSNYDDVFNVFQIFNLMSEANRTAFFANEANILNSYDPADPSTLPSYLTAVQIGMLKTYKGSHDSMPSFQTLYGNGIFSFESMWNNLDKERFEVLKIFESKTKQLVIDYFGQTGGIFNVDGTLKNLEYVPDADKPDEKANLFTSDEISQISSYQSSQITKYNNPSGNYISSIWSDYLSNPKTYQIYHILDDATGTGRNIFFNNEATGSLSILETKLSDANIATIDVYVDTAKYSTVNAAVADYIKEYDEFDQFDTLVGSHTDLYESQMKATVKVTGVQVTPTLETTAATTTAAPAPAP